MLLVETNLSRMRWRICESSGGGRVRFLDLLVMCCRTVNCCGEGGGSWRNRLAVCPARIGAKWWPTGFIRLSLWRVDPVGSSDRTDACLRAWWKHNGVLVHGQRERLDVGVFQFQSIRYDGSHLSVF